MDEWGRVLHLAWRCGVIVLAAAGGLWLHVVALSLGSPVSKTKTAGQYSAADQQVIAIVPVPAQDPQLIDGPLMETVPSG